MKRAAALLVILCLAGFAASGIGTESVYDLVVPQSYSTLSVSGALGSLGNSSLGNNVLEIDLSGGTTSFSIGGTGMYYYMHQDEDTFFEVDAEATVFANTTSAGIDLPINNLVRFKSYTLDLEGYPGFIAAGGDGTLNLRTTGITTEIRPYIGVGVGREYSIDTILTAEVMMKHLGVEPTEERVRAAAEVMYTSAKIFSQYTDDRRENAIEYYTQLAAAMGIPDRVLDVIFITSSQIYDYEVARYTGFTKGWEAMVSLNPTFSYFTTASFSGTIDIGASYGDFFLDQMLYAKAWATGSVGFNSGLTYGLSADLQAVYLPEDYRWWAEGHLELGVSNSSSFSADVLGEGHYLLNPNFDIHAGAQIGTSGLKIFAGGFYRIW
ncbi:MAG: hypothetical protein K9M84_04045 [Spirochaetia bacterium]|nr:hypothetical protein [Spirochaetia bacterium]MCF7940760.1 hypothetical protein [Spirochaetia bacterium]